MISYSPLFKILIDKRLTKTDFRIMFGISSATLARMGKNEYVSLELIDDICRKFNCQPGELIEYIDCLPEDMKKCSEA